MKMISHLDSDEVEYRLREQLEERRFRGYSIKPHKYFEGEMWYSHFNMNQIRDPFLNYLLIVVDGKIVKEIDHTRIDMTVRYRTSTLLFIPFYFIVLLTAIVALFGSLVIFGIIFVFVPLALFYIFYFNSEASVVIRYLKKLIEV